MIRSMIIPCHHCQNENVKHDGDLIVTVYMTLIHLQVQQNIPPIHLHMVYLYFQTKHPNTEYC